MSHEEQLPYQQNLFRRDTLGHPNDHDDECYDTDPEVTRHRSKLRILYHAATCSCDELSDCPAGVVHCCASKRVFAHISTCTAGHECDVPGCQHSRIIWGHYRICRKNRKGSILPDGNALGHYHCGICSAVPLHHDAITFCSRFRTTNPPFRYATKDVRCGIRNRTSFENRSLDVGRDNQEREKCDEHDCLPVWRKRNLLHAKQQQSHQRRLPLHEKENTARSTIFPALSSKTENLRVEGSNRSIFYGSKVSKSFCPSS
mmetsp:Transcript_3624/g.7919  ORF Transcript_3624/g.7919 Transcript_3624/m.7919 type:complete len:259 (-) Transcript_3624:75-851(-)